MPPPKQTLLSITSIEERIHLVRGQRVVLNMDLAELHGVTTKRLNEQIKRNRERFPADFMFLLTEWEVSNLRSQIATSSWGGRRTVPSAFTEHGTVMAVTVASSLLPRYLRRPFDLDLFRRVRVNSRSCVIWGAPDPLVQRRPG